ncbi:MAG: hypothetical protein AAGJ35_02865, partial [Myxococcota bacterium]
NIGYLQDAKDMLLKMLGISNARFVGYRRQPSLTDLLFGLSRVPAMMERSAKPTVQDLLSAQTPKAWYLWPAAQRK